MQLDQTFKLAEMGPKKCNLTAQSKPANLTNKDDQVDSVYLRPVSPLISKLLKSKKRYFPTQIFFSFFIILCLISIQCLASGDIQYDLLPNLVMYSLPIDMWSSSADLFSLVISL